jgi:hypothetical protein
MQESQESEESAFFGPYRADPFRDVVLPEVETLKLLRKTFILS